MQDAEWLPMSPGREGRCGNTSVKLNPWDQSLPAKSISIPKQKQEEEKSPHTFAHLANFSKNVFAMFDNHMILLL